MSTATNSQDPLILNQGKMFIGGLSSITTENSLRIYFTTFGDVIDPVIMRDKDSNTSRGFGFITFRDPAVLDMVLSLTPHIVDGKQVDCKRAVPKEATQQLQQQQMLMQQHQQNIKRNQQHQQQQQQQQHYQHPQYIQQQQPNQQQIQQQKKGQPQNQAAVNQNQKKQQKQQQQQYKKTLQQQQQLIEEQKQQIEMLAQQHQQYQSQQRYQYQQQQQYQPQYQKQFQQSYKSNSQISQDLDRRQPQKQQQHYSNNGQDIKANQSQITSAPLNTAKPQQEFRFLDDNQESGPKQTLSSQNNSQISGGSNQNDKPSAQNQRDNLSLQDRQNSHRYPNSGGSSHNESLIGSPTISVSSEILNDSNKTQSLLAPQAIPSQQIIPIQPPQLETQYRKIFVGGLPHNLSDEEFKQYFAVYGEIEDSAILKDKRTGKPRGFGFVTYKDLVSLERVMDLKDSHVIQGKWVDCKRAVPANQMKESQQQVQQNLTQNVVLDQRPLISDPQFAQQIIGTSQNQSTSNVTPGSQNQTALSFANSMNSYGQSINSQNPFSLTLQNPNSQQSSQGVPQQYQYYQQNIYQQPNTLLNLSQQQNTLMASKSQDSKHESEHLDPQNRNQLQSQFSSSSQPFYRNNIGGPQQAMNTSPAMQQPQKQYQSSTGLYQNGPPQANVAAHHLPPPGFQVLPSQYTQQVAQGVTLGSNAAQQPQQQQQQQPRSYLYQNPSQFSFSQGFPMGGQQPAAFPSGFPYSQTFKQQILNGQLQAGVGVGLQDQAQSQGSNILQFNLFTVEQLNRKQQESTEWHIQSLNTLYSGLHLEDSEAKQQKEIAEAQSTQENESTLDHQKKQETINNLNEEIKEIEGKEDDDNSNFDSKSDINWHEETNKSNISGFYTNYPNNGQQPQLQMTPQDESQQQRISFSEPIESDQRPYGYHHARGNSQSNQSLRKRDVEGYDTPQPQEEVSDTTSERSQTYSNPPQLKRVESEGNIITNQPEVQQLRGRHILGSGKDFQYGVDRPSSKASSDKNGGKNNSAKPEYGQLRSQGTLGPSKRADRQYKPF